jgi:FkbM family methyltransferase
MRINLPNILYAARHPLQAVRYVRRRDSIPLEKIASYLPEDPVILEAGAHNGSSTVLLARHWPRCTIHAFEPVPSAFEELVSRCQPFRDRIFCNNAALGSQDAVLDMHLSGDGSAGSCQSSSLLAPSQKHEEEYNFVKFEKSVPVRVMRIDQWAEEAGIRKLDFLRLDMQGYEIEALKGAGSYLDGVAALQLEVSNVPLYQGAPLCGEVCQWLKKRGFMVAYEAIFRVGGNVLFVNVKYDA